jgi:uncharacterized protein YyaL (SSP411 family)
MSNRLGRAASAYLRSAAHQPIHWFPWSDEAFAAASRDDRPILLDIGAVWCHWCHVMDGESYEDPRLAEFLNQHFVCIKVDRDERPDVDARYQRAVQAITRQGGWPLTAFLTPAGQVFYGGTYFPPDGRYGRPGFRSVLEQVLRVYREERERVEQQALTLGRLLLEEHDPARPDEPGPGLLQAADRELERHFDPQHGGFGSQPKFPHPGAVLWLLTRWYDTANPDLRRMASRTLEGMARGGMYDQLAGGFHRYSVDAQWMVPHFEKMSYDNAELLRAYVAGYQVTGDPLCRATAVGIIQWVREVLADPAGGYAASQDADVGLEDDGDYFTWTLDEARDAIGDETALAVASAYYDIGTAGEMQHDPAKNVLFVAEPLDRIATRLGLDPDAAAGLLQRATDRLRAARALRPIPQVDRTRYTSWNGMLAAALLYASSAIGDPWAREHALRTLRRIRTEQPDPTRLRHAPSGVGGLLDDQVQMAQAALEAFEVTGDPDWLGWCEALMDQVWADYHDPEAGGLFDIAGTSGAGLLPIRLKPIQDAPTPSPNGVAALCLARLAEHTGDRRWTDRHRELVRTFAAQVVDLGLFGAAMLLGVDWAVHPPTWLVVIEAAEPRPAERELADAMYQVALETFVPRRVVRLVRGGGPGGPLPAALAAAAAAGTGTRGLACRGATCELPASSLDAWMGTLARLRPTPTS